MFDMLIKQILPPGFDFDKLMKDLQTTVVHVVSTVNRIEAKVDALAKAQAATVPPTLIASNDDRQQQPDAASGHPDAPGADAPGHATPGASNAGNPAT